MLNNIVKEPLRDMTDESPEDRQFYDELTQARLRVLELISRNLTDFGERFPAETCVDGYYPLTDNVEWTTSFWTGQLWLAGDERG